jgi:hypothetical protein
VDCCSSAVKHRNTCAQAALCFPAEGAEAVWREAVCAGVLKGLSQQSLHVTDLVTSERVCMLHV